MCGCTSHTAAPDHHSSAMKRARPAEWDLVPLLRLFGDKAQVDRSMLERELVPYLDTPSVAALSATCRQLHAWFAGVRRQRILRSVEHLLSALTRIDVEAGLESGRRRSRECDSGYRLAYVLKPVEDRGSVSNDAVLLAADHAELEGMQHTGGRQVRLPWTVCRALLERDNCPHACRVDSGSATAIWRQRLLVSPVRRGDLCYLVASLVPTTERHTKMIAPYLQIPVVIAAIHLRSGRLSHGATPTEEEIRQFCDGAPIPTADDHDGTPGVSAFPLSEFRQVSIDQPEEAELRMEHRTTNFMCKFSALSIISGLREPLPLPESDPDAHDRCASFILKSFEMCICLHLSRYAPFPHQPAFTIPRFS